jgi:hypothetical protein
MITQKRARTLIKELMFLGVNKSDSQQVEIFFPNNVSTRALLDSGAGVTCMSTGSEALSED